MADLPKPSDLLGKKLPKPQDLLKKKEVTQPVSGIGGQTSKLGFEPFQDQVPTKTPSVLTTKGATEYKEQVKDYKPPVQKTASKPKTLTEAVSNDDSYIGALWNQIPGAVSDFVGGLSKIAGKGAAQMYGKPIQSLVDVVNKAGGQNIVNPIDQFATDENIEKVGKVGEKAVKKLRTSASSEEYEKSIQEGFDITDGIGFADIKAVPIMLSRLVADAGLSIPTGGLSFVAQGYNQGLNEYDEAVKGIPKELRTDNAREGFAVIYGTINGLADKLGLDLITKSKPVSETVKKFILKEAVQELAKKEVKNLTSEAIEKTISSIAQKTFNKVKSVGVKTVIGAGVESVTESIQGGLSDGLKVLTNKLSDSNIFDVDEIKKNFWKSRINDAAGGFVLGGALGGAMNSLRSTDSYISERVAESTTPEQIQQLKEELANSVDDQGNPLLDEERIDILNQAIDKYSESNQKLPAGLSTQKRAKVLQLMSERDSIKELIGSASQELNNIDEAVRPESEKDLIILQNKEQQKNDEIREAVSGNKYKYYQDEDGKFFKKIGNESPTEITEDYFNLQNQDSEIKQTKPKEDAIQEQVAKPKKDTDIETKSSEISPYGVIAADYLFTGGSNVILSTDYFVQALSGSFIKAGGLIEQIRNKYINKVGDLGNIRESIGTENYNEMIAEIRDAINTTYNNKEVNDIFDVVLNNATGFPNRLGNDVSSRLEQINEETTTAQPTQETTVDALKDVESTAKALTDDIVQELGDKLGKLFPLSEDTNTNIAKEYHKAKADGSNPKLVQAVEDLLKPKPKQDAIQEQGINDDSEIEIAPEEKSKYESQREALAAKEKEILARIRKRLGNVSSGFNPDVISDLVELGVVYIQNGVINFKEFKDKMINDFGSNIPDKDLMSIYESSAKKLGFGIRNTPKRVGADEGLSPELREVAQETDSVYQQQNFQEVQDRLDNMTEADKNALVGTLANVTGQLNAEGNIGVLAAIDLINGYQASGDKAGIQRVFDIISKSATAFAQLLRQYGQLKSSTSQGYVSIVEKAMLDKYNIKLTDQQKLDMQNLYEQAQAESKNLETTLDDLVKTLDADGYKKWGEATVKLEDATRALQDYVDGLKPKDTPSLFSKLTSIVQGNLLSLKSLIVNPFANTIQAIVRFGENEVANAADLILSFVTGTRTKISGAKPSAVKLSGKASLRGLKKAGRLLMKGATSEDMAKVDVSGRLKPFKAWKDLFRGLTGKDKYSFVEGLNDVSEATSGLTANLALRMLPFGDLPFSEQAKTFKLVEIGITKFNLKGKALEAFTLKPDKESLAEAENYGDKATLQNKNGFYSALTNLINRIDSNATNSFSKGVSAALKFYVRGVTVPFLKTPINYAVKAFRFTNPSIPFLQAGYHGFMLANSSSKIKNSLLRGQAIRKHQAKMTEYLGEAIIAQSVMVVAILLIKNGLVTGDAPKEEDESKERGLMYATFVPNGINISGLKRLLAGESPKTQQGDKVISYLPMGILGAQLGIKANTLYKTEKEKAKQRKYITTEGESYYNQDEGWASSMISNITGNLPASLNFTLNQGFAQGAGTLLSAIQDNSYDDWSSQVVKTVVTGLAVPNTVSMSLKAANEYTRNIRSEDTVERWGNVVKEIYGNVEDLPVKYDMWGKPIKQTPEGANPYVYNVIDIFRTRDILTDKIMYSVFDLYSKTGDKSLIPSSVSDIIDEEQGLYKKLDPKQKSELQRMVGEERYKIVSGAISSGMSLKSYNPNNNDETYIKQQSDKLKDAYSSGLKQGKRRFEREVLRKVKK